MATPRFFSSTPLAAHTTIELPDALAHHAIRVLRLKPDSDIVLFDGQGGQYAAKLIFDGKRGHAVLSGHDPVEAELEGRITLVQGIPAGDKMDWVIEKAVELGAIRVIPIAARRSVLQLSGDRLRKRLEHWRRIAQAASEQSGRNRIMEIAEPCSLERYLADGMTDAASTLFCQPGSPRSLAQALHAGQTELSFLVGPEGGWSDEEQELVARHTLTGVSFGKRVLRTETAGLALIAAASALQGWN
jgi:16S rRNA (uracil1498-N3)-methyltransferase